jgi:hypothetical protein
LAAPASFTASFDRYIALGLMRSDTPEERYG